MTGEAANSPIRRSGRHALPTKLETPLPAALYLFRPELCPRTRKSAAHQCSKQDAPCPSFRCRSPVQLREGFPKGRGLALVPRPLGGWFPKAGAKAPGLCVVSRGAGGNRNPPAFLFRGAGGEILFSKENIPLGFSSRKPGLPFVGAKKMWETFCTAKPCYPCTA